MFLPENVTNLQVVMAGPSGTEGELITSLAFDTSGPPDASARDDAVDALGTSTWVNDFIHTNILFVALRFVTGTAEPSEPIVVEQGLEFTGGAGDVMAPISVAWLARKVTALGGRKNRGRMYWPGVQMSALQDAGIVEGPVVTSGTEALADLAADLGTALGSVFPVVLHTDPLDAPTPLTALQLANKVATQRTRLRD